MIVPYATYPTLSKDECASLIETHKNTLHEGRVGNETVSDNSIRKSNITWVEDTAIAEKCIEAVNKINSSLYNFDLTDLEVLQFGEYDIDGHYNWHLDLDTGQNSNRKLSFTILLNDDFEGGDLEMMYSAEPEQIPLQVGVMTAFPSFQLHRVAPVTCGKRYSLVGWMYGPDFR
jgi:PKHD-type hydroxylase